MFDFLAALCSVGPCGLKWALSGPLESDKRFPANRVSVLRVVWGCKNLAKTGLRDFLRVPYHIDIIA